MDVEKYAKFVSQIQTEKRIYDSQRDLKLQEFEKRSLYSEDLTTAKDVMNAVGIIAQSEFKDVIEALVTQALQYVFGTNYSFLMENILFRNQPETHMYVLKDGKKRSLKDEQGGGVLDVVSIALRIVFWAIDIANTEPVLIFDEPAKFVSEDKIELVGEILKKISEMLGLQIILVSHENGLINTADRCYLVKMVGDTSQVEKIV